MWACDKSFERVLKIRRGVWPFCVICSFICTRMTCHMFRAAKVLLQIVMVGHDFDEELCVCVCDVVFHKSLEVL